MGLRHVRLSAALLCLGSAILAGACADPLSAQGASSFTDAGVGEEQQDAGIDPSSPDGAPGDCSEGGPGCTCAPIAEEPGCTHTVHGGEYGHRACSSSYQCCGGSWLAGHGSCGGCACVEATGTVGCQGSEEVECFAAFEGTSEPIPPSIRDEMRGVSWHEGMGCPGFDELRLLRFPHWGFDGTIHQGELVVAASVADDVLMVFERMYDDLFPIERIERVDAFGGDDDASMAANNTSAFNCRKVAGGSSLSQHSYGTAIDINPVQNPYVRDATILPPSGADYANRSDLRKGMITAGSSAFQAFGDIGWKWGGNWTSLKDYQHFSQNGL